MLRRINPDAVRLLPPALVAASALLFAACASNPPAPVVDLSAAAPSSPQEPSGRKPLRAESGVGSYRVVAGDTLYAIAFRHGLDFRDVAAWNHIPPPYRIYAGQELRLQGAGAPGATTQAPVPATAATVAPAPLSPAKPAPNTASAAKPPAAKPSAAGPSMFEDVPVEAAAHESTPAVATSPPTEKSAERPAPSTEPPSRTTPVESSAAPARAATASSAPAVDSVATAANGIAWRWPGRGSLIGTYVAGDQTRQGIDIAGNAGDPVLAAADGEVVYSGNGLLGYGELIIVKHNASFLSAYGHNRKRLVQEGQKIKGGQQIAEMGSSASARDELHFEIRRNGKPVNPLDYLPAR